MPEVKALTKEYKIARATIEGVRSGYLVGLLTVDGQSGDLKTFPDSDDGYADACAMQDAINAGGTWVGRQDHTGLTVHISNKNAVFTKFRESV